MRLIQMIIPKRQLEGLGFIQIEDGLFVKNIGKVKLFRDYRGKHPVSYAYFKKKAVDHVRFKECEAIQKIEVAMAQTIMGYVEA